MRWRLSIILLFGVAGCASPTAPSGLITVSGRVLNFSSDAGVAGAQVEFWQEGPPSANTVQIVNGTAVTDLGGSYQLRVPAAERYNIRVDVDRSSHGSTVPGSSAHRGDFLVYVGTCVSRYGQVFDEQSRKPISGAIISLFTKTVVTGLDGWYRIDFGCPAQAFVGGNTTFMYARHPRYEDGSTVTGRGVEGTARWDFLLHPL
jgi:hypothetical protein